MASKNLVASNLLQLTCRCISFHRPRSPTLSIQQAEKWVSKLKPEERALLRQALEKTEVHSSEVPKTCDLPMVTGGDYWKVAVQNGLPFVGFGFLDNAIMILAVSYFFSPYLIDIH